MCIIEGCDRPSERNAPGWGRVCTMHWHRIRRSGSPDRVKMSNKGLTCRATGCSLPAAIKGLCDTCYVRAKQHGGDPDVRTTKAAHADDLWTRLWRQTTVVGECWVSSAAGTGSRRQGYRGIRWQGVWKTVHRWAYLEYVDPTLPSTLDLHHLCGTKACWRPDHLVPLTRLEHRHAHPR